LLEWQFLLVEGVGLLRVLKHLDQDERDLRKIICASTRKENRQEELVLKQLQFEAVLRPLEHTVEQLIEMLLRLPLPDEVEDLEDQFLLANQPLEELPHQLEVKNHLLVVYCQTLEDLKPRAH